MNQDPTCPSSLPSPSTDQTAPDRTSGDPAPTVDLPARSDSGTVDWTASAPPEERSQTARVAHDRTAAPGDFTGAFVPQRDETVDHPTGRPAKAAKGKTVKPGAQTGRFVLKKFHARGGMGEVWVAEDTDIGRVVALKKIRSGREAQVDKFLHEAQITGQLEHPGVVPVHELGVDGEGQPFYVMKFVHGRTLKEAIDDYHSSGTKPADSAPTAAVPREVQLVQLLQVFIHLCQTVAYAHSRNVIHRDLKPDNVMVGQYGETLVLDWGLAKILGQGGTKDTISDIRLSGGDGELTEYGSIKGTPGYMSPEVAEGRSGEVDQVSDVYLLGGCLYQILTGKRPRHSAKVMEMVEQARKQPPTPPRKLDRTVPKPLNAICVKALAMFKEHRYTTALALAEDVQRYLAGEPVTAYRETLLERGWRWVRKHRVGLGRAALGVAALAIVGGGAWAFHEAQLEAEAKLKEAEIQRLTDLQIAKEAEDEKLRLAEEKRKKTAAEALAAKQEQERLERLRQAESDRDAFRRLAEEMQFFNVMYDKADSAEALYDPALAEQRGRSALETLGKWGQRLDTFPLDKETEALRKEQYALLLSLAHLLLLRDEQPATAEEATALLKRAEEQQAPTAGFYHLRAIAGQRLGKLREAAGDRTKAQHKATPATAWDHYLLGNHFLAESVRASGTAEAGRTAEQRAQARASAIGHYLQAQQIDPQFYWAYWQTGRCFGLLGDAKVQSQCMAQCVALKPVSPCSHTVRAIAFFALNRDREAFESLVQALAMAPDFRPAYLHRGIFHMLKKNYDDALSDFGNALLPPAEQQLPQAAYYRGQVYLLQGKTDKALADFDLAVQGKRPLRDAHLKRAQVCFMLDKTAEGLASIDKYLRSDLSAQSPEAEWHEFRGAQLHQLALEMSGNARREQLTRAKAELQMAVDQKRATPALYSHLGDVHMRLGETAAAINAYTASLKLSPNNVKVLMKRGLAHDRTRPANYAEGQKDYAAAARLEPVNAEAHAGVGYMSACLQDEALAMKHANLALLHGAGDYLILHNVACIYSKLSEVDPKRQVAFENLALDQLRRGNELWRRDPSGPDAIILMERERAFSESLKARKEFKDLLVR
jgi:Tfp pilus assembly protein PilF/tRNA A-37 threonylcarbamoyl transferase component Bud32